jgi:hypothetical protein
VGSTTSYKSGRNEIISFISDSVEVVHYLLLRFIHIPQDHHLSITITFKDFRYNILNHSQLLPSGVPVVAPRLEVHINKMCRALQPGIVKHLDMDQPVQSMGYFIGREPVGNGTNIAIPQKSSFAWRDIGSSQVPLHLQGVVPRRAILGFSNCTRM